MLKVGLSVVPEEKAEPTALQQRRDYAATIGVIINVGSTLAQQSALIWYILQLLQSVRNEL